MSLEMGKRQTYTKFMAKKPKKAVQGMFMPCVNLTPVNTLLRAPYKTSAK
jgi:hypothetical protein